MAVRVGAPMANKGVAPCKVSHTLANVAAFPKPHAFGLRAMTSGPVMMSMGAVRCAPTLRMARSSSLVPSPHAGAFAASRGITSVRPAMSSEAWENSMDQQPEDRSQPRLFVGNLPWSVDSATLGEVFEDHGKVQECTVMFDRNTGRSRGFAFVTFETMESAEAAKAALDGAEVGGRNLRVTFPLLREGGGRGERRPFRDFDGPAVTNRQNFPEGTRCYVGNLAWTTDSKELGDLATQYGTVLEARVVTDRETGRSRGFGFLAFETVEEADSAVQGMDGTELGGRMIRCRIATP